MGEAAFARSPKKEGKRKGIEPKREKREERIVYTCEPYETVGSMMLMLIQCRGMNNGLLVKYTGT